MSIFNWAELDRLSLARVLPKALVVMPLGSVEQHGRHLPTGTDYLLASAVASAAATRAASAMSRDIVVTPTLTFGASDHHLPFGGTISLQSQTLLAVLTDLLISAESAGVRRAVLVNGHGGNSGICHAAAATASSKSSLTVAHVDYWKVLPEGRGMPGVPFPGHAGAFETSMVLANHPDLVLERPVRDDPPSPLAIRGVEVHSASHWAEIDGFSDHPERATVDEGHRLMEELTDALSAAFIELAREA